MAMYIVLCFIQSQLSSDNRVEVYIDLKFCASKPVLQWDRVGIKGNARVPRCIFFQENLLCST